MLKYFHCLKIGILKFGALCMKIVKISNTVLMSYRVFLKLAMEFLTVYPVFLDFHAGQILSNISNLHNQCF